MDYRPTSDEGAISKFCALKCGINVVFQRVNFSLQELLCYFQNTTLMLWDWPIGGGGSVLLLESRGKSSNQRKHADNHENKR
jgi:hypothetical protein